MSIGVILMRMFVHSPNTRMLRTRRHDNGDLQGRICVESETSVSLGCRSTGLDDGRHLRGGRLRCCMILSPVRPLTSSVLSHQYQGSHRNVTKSGLLSQLLDMTMLIMVN